LALKYPEARRNIGLQIYQKEEECACHVVETGVLETETLEKEVRKDFVSPMR
jgi:hypothetical protein